MTITRHQILAPPPGTTGPVGPISTDKSRILTAQVWLSDMSLFFAHNEAWNEWVDPDNPPARACIEARLTHPQLLVEVMVTAAR